MSSGTSREETTYFDEVYSGGEGFTGKKVVNNAMPPQMKKLFPKLNYLCNTSILDPMGSFGSCNKVHFHQGTEEYDLDYRITADTLNFIKIKLPIKAINDVSIVNGEVEVVVNGEHMVKDEFTLTHFNSEEPFSISNIVSQLRPITDDMNDVDKKDALQNNRNILFRKFMGDFLQALQVFTNIKEGNNDVYYTSNDKPASIMLQILLYSLTSPPPYSNGSGYPLSPGFNGLPGNYGGHIEKHKPPGETDPKKYKWKVNYHLSKLHESMEYYKGLIKSQVTGGVVMPGGGNRKGKTKRRSKRRKTRKNIRRKTKKNTRRKTKKNTRRKTRKNTQRTSKRRTKRSRRK